MNQFSGRFGNLNPGLVSGGKVASNNDGYLKALSNVYASADKMKLGREQIAGRMDVAGMQQRGANDRAVLGADTRLKIAANQTYVAFQRAGLAHQDRVSMLQYLHKNMDATQAHQMKRLMLDMWKFGEEQHTKAEKDAFDMDMRQRIEDRLSRMQTSTEAYQQGQLQQGAQRNLLSAAEMQYKIPEMQSRTAYNLENAQTLGDFRASQNEARKAKTAQGEEQLGLNKLKIRYQDLQSQRKTGESTLNRQARLQIAGDREKGTNDRWNATYNREGTVQQQKRADSYAKFFLGEKQKWALEQKAATMQQDYLKAKAANKLSPEMVQAIDSFQPTEDWQYFISPEAALNELVNQALSRKGGGQ